MQRLETINLFLADIYSDQKCLRDGVIPHDLVFERGDFRREIIGTRPRHGIYTHVVGTDLLRGDDGQFLVLEDNCRCPSGVSYVLENRNLLSRVFPELFSQYGVRPVEQYPQMLLDTLRFTAPRGRENPTVAVLTPGVFNSAYFEHSFLAREMGVPLVEGRDLIVEDDQVYMRTTRGKQRVDVIYRRIDDEYIDPVVFDPSSMLGVPGLIHAWQAGNVTIANAPGAGVADDKAIYPWVPDLVKYYLDEEVLLPQIKTWVGRRPDEAAYIRDHLPELVVKLAGAPVATACWWGQRPPRPRSPNSVRHSTRIPAYIAQPLVEFSSHPTYIDGNFVPRRVDLRPFALWGTHPHSARRTHQGGFGGRLLCCQFLPGWRKQGHLDSRGSPTGDQLMRGMLSRAGENIYWMGRYVERSAEICRMLQVGEQLTVELRGLSPEMACSFWRQLQAIYPGSVAPDVDGSDVDEVSLSYVWCYLVGPGNDLSVASSIRRARENARAVREYLTREVFELINECWLQLDVDVRSAGSRQIAPDQVVSRVTREVYGISGAIDRTFIRDEAWLFLTMGMMFERMYRGLLVIKHRLPILLEHPADIDIPIHHARVRGVLRTLASLENYRRVYGADLNPDQVARFLLFDEHTPHSVRACLGRMEQAINILEAGTGMTEAGRLIGRLSSRLRYEENDLMALDDLEAVCSELVASVTEVNDVLSHQYFTT